MAKPLRLTQISCSLLDTLGGPTRVVKESHSRLSPYVESNLVIFGEVEDCVEAEIFPSILNNRYGIPRKFIWNRAVRTLTQSDVILIHGFYTFVTLFTLAYGNKEARYFLMPHGSLENYQSKRNRYLKFLFQILFISLVRKRNFTFVVASEQEKISIRHKFPNYSIEILGLGVEYMGEATVRRNDVETLKLVCISRIAKKKRIDLCIRAVKLMRDEGIKVELHILGDGDIDLTNSLKDFAQILDLNLAVHFHGHLTREAIKQILPRMHIFLLPSENENFAIAVAEAISQGLPTVISDNVAMHNFVETNKTGVVISKLSTESLINAIKDVKANLESYSINAVNSRSLLSWDEVIKIWVKVLCK